MEETQGALYSLHSWCPKKFAITLTTFAYVIYLKKIVGTCTAVGACPGFLFHYSWLFPCVKKTGSCGKGIQRIKCYHSQTTYCSSSTKPQQQKAIKLVDIIPIFPTWWKWFSLILHKNYRYLKVIVHDSLCHKHNLCVCDQSNLC